MIKFDCFCLTIGMFDTTFNRLENKKRIEEKSECKMKFTSLGANLFNPTNEILSSGLILS
jgi:hypothetical protein